MSLITKYEDTPTISNIWLDDEKLEDYDFTDKSRSDYESFQVEKRNGKLYFISNGGFQSRNSSTIWCIKEADKLYKWPDFSRITIITNDGYCKKTEYAYSTQSTDYSNVIPDFNFRHWAEVGLTDYEESIDLIENAGKTQFLENKVGWIGNIETNIIRAKLLEIGLRYKNDLDIFSSKEKFVSMPDLVKTYAILIDVEGYGYSGRLKYLLFSQRPILLVERPHKEYFYEFMKPWIHYIPVNRDLSNLIDMIDWIKKNYKDAEVIAQNALNFAKKYCVRDSAFKQWNKIISALC